MATIPEEEQLIVENSVSTNILEVVGQGVDFPFRFTDSGKVRTIATSNAGERISDSIYLILSTRIGERFFNPEFGSRLPELVFEPNDVKLKNLLKHYTVEALQRWEKRIKILNVILLDNLDADQNKIGISIEYKIRNSHIKGSYVFPFVREGMPTSALYTGSESRRLREPGSLE